MRNRLQAIEALVDVLDSLEPDVDLEDNGDNELTADEEPRLGATNGLHQSHAWQVPTDDADEAEPSLGSVGEGRGFHGMALPGYPMIARKRTSMAEAFSTSHTMKTTRVNELSTWA